MRLRHLFWLVPLAALAGCILVLAAGWVTIPRHYNPFAPLDVRDPPTLATGFKLLRTDRDIDFCRAALATSGLSWTPVDDVDHGGGCGLTDAVRVTAGATRLNGAFLASCPLAVGWAMFERHSLQPLAQDHFGAAVTGVTHFGSYACRNVRGSSGPSARRSEHATAEALDIAGFTLADGREIRLVRDWARRNIDGEASAAAAFCGRPAMVPAIFSAMCWGPTTTPPITTISISACGASASAGKTAAIAPGTAGCRWLPRPCRRAR